MIFPFVVGLTLFVIFGQSLITTVISGLTFVKGSLLVVVVLITGIIAGEAQQKYEDDWTAVGEPFLISTVALGGVINVMPVYYQKVSYVKEDIKKFKFSIFGKSSLPSLSLSTYLSVYLQHLHPLPYPLP